MNDSNFVTYLGQITGRGGYTRITSCARWQTSLAMGRYRYLALTPGPTASPPLAWTQDDSDLRPLLHPAPNAWVFTAVSHNATPHCA